MILKLEYFNKDTFLNGKNTPFCELQKQLNETEHLCDAEYDNFTALFCRMFQWDIVDSDDLPDYVYDRDIKRLYKNRSR